MGMHIYFSGIGGTGIGPLALIAHQAGYEVSGSDKQQSQYTDYLQKHGIRFYIGQTTEAITKEHAEHPIDWIVYSSALPLEQPNHPELIFAKEHNIKTSKRDACLNAILAEKKLDLIAVAGTHGKTTATAMIVWLYKVLELPLSYSVGAKINFGDMGTYSPDGKYFAYECDEFDRNFLHFQPSISIITSVDWDHHEIYPTRDTYKQAFRQFISQSAHVFIFEKDALYLDVDTENISVISDNDPHISRIKLAGEHNRRNARMAIAAVQHATGESLETLIELIGQFPGSSRRFEQIAPRLYSDYAHTPEEVAATIQLAKEISNDVVVVYEPLTDRRQHFAKESYATIFESVSKLYWLPSYLAREDKNQSILSPDELIGYLSPATNAVTAKKNELLRESIDAHLANGSLVLCLAGGGGSSLDEWIRQVYANKA